MASMELKLRLVAAFLICCAAGSSVATAGGRERGKEIRKVAIVSSFAPPQPRIPRRVGGVSSTTRQHLASARKAEAGGGGGGAAPQDIRDREDAACVRICRYKKFFYDGEDFSFRRVADLPLHRDARRF